MIIIHFDGGCVSIGGGKLVAGFGFTIQDGNKLYQGAKILDKPKVLTSNVGEYSGLIYALSELKKLQKLHRIEENVPVRIYGDSQLIVNMVGGVWGSKGYGHKDHEKAPHLRPLLQLAVKLMPVGATIEWIPREKNGYCDQLYNIALKKYRNELIKTSMASDS